MYRQYEDPYAIERMIESLEISMSEAIRMDDEAAQISIAERDINTAEDIEEE